MLLAAAVVVIELALKVRVGPGGAELHPADGVAGVLAVLIGVVEILGVDVLLPAGGHGVADALGGGDVIDGVVGGGGADSPGRHLAGGVAGLAGVGRGAAGVGGHPAHEAVAPAAGIGGRAGVGGGAALDHVGLGLEGGAAVHEGDGHIGRAHVIAAGVALAVQILVDVAALVGPVAAGAALLPVAGAVGLPVGEEAVGLMGLLHAADRAGLPVGVLVGAVPGGPGVGDGLLGRAAAHQALALMLAAVRGGLIPGAPLVLAVGAVRRHGRRHHARHHDHRQQYRRHLFLPESVHTLSLRKSLSEVV